MDVKELAKYRHDLIRTACAFKEKPERVPHISFFVTWKIIDAGVPLSLATHDYSVMEKVVCEHLEKYKFDALMEAGNRNPVRITEALGSSIYVVSDENYAINYTDCPYCEDDELLEMAADYDKFLWEKAMPRRYPFFGEEFDIDIFQNVVNEFVLFGKETGRIRNLVDEKYGLPHIYAPNMYPGIPVEGIFSAARGIKKFSLDMRKRPDELSALLEAIANKNYYPTLEAFKKTDVKPSEDCLFDMGAAWLAHNVMNVKQWDRFYWPYLKPLLDQALAKGLNYFTFAEGSSLRFKDYLNDYPKGVITMLPELDDVFVIRKEMPNIVIMGGMPNTLIYGGTKKECLDRAKKCIDELGCDGGYIMTQNKMGSFKTDANPENLKAICDFVYDYK